MATVTGPLHSDAAHGTVNKQLTFRTGKRRTTVTGYNFPGSRNPFTPNAAQLAVRARTKLIMQSWEALTTEQKATWFELAASRNLEPDNVYLQENYRRTAAGQEISPVWPPNDTPPVPAVTLTNLYTNLGSDWASWSSENLPEQYVAALTYAPSLPISPGVDQELGAIECDQPNYENAEFEYAQTPPGYYYLVIYDTVTYDVLTTSSVLQK